MTTDALDKFVFEFARDHDAYPAPLALSRLPKIDLHLDQSRRLPRHSRRQAAARRRHPQYRRDAHRRRLARRFEPHVCRGRSAAPRAAADRGHLRVRCCAASPRSSRARRPATSAHAIQSYAESERCSVVRDFCGHGLGRLFHDEPNILHVGQARRGRAVAPRHVLHHRADDQSRRLRA